MDVVIVPFTGLHFLCLKLDPKAATESDGEEERSTRLLESSELWSGHIADGRWRQWQTLKASWTRHNAYV